MHVRTASLVGILGSVWAIGCGALQGGSSETDPANTGGQGASGPGGPGAGAVANHASPTDYVEDEFDQAQLAPQGCADDLPSTRIVHAIADDSHSFGSAAYAASALSAYPDDAFGLPPVPSAVTPVHMINHYGLGYTQADHGVLEATRSVDPLGELLDSEITVQVAFLAPPNAVRRAVDVVFVVDTSGSMGGASMARQKEILEVAAASLGVVDGSPDTVSVVSWNSDSRVLLEPTPISEPNHPLLKDVIAGLETSGGSDLALGLQTAYELLSTAGSERSRRMVFITDGAAAIDPAAEQVLATIGSASAETGLGFIGIGVGAADAYQPNLLRDVVAKTGGTFVYAGGDGALEELGARFDGLMDNVYFDVQLRLELPGFLDIEPVDPLLASEAELLRTHDLAVGGTMVFRRNLIACSPEVLKTPDIAGQGITGRILFKTHPLGDYDSLDLEPIAVSSALEPEPTHLLRARALLSYADAIRAPSPSRIAQAITVLEDAELSVLSNLLGRHPALDL